MVNLLWTGGWDSTFRLLQLAHAGEEVQPHYILDENRKSFKKEIQTMKDIRKEVNRKFPKAVVHEIKITTLPEISICKEFTKAHRNLLSKGWIGSQYISISSYCKNNNISNMEISIEYPNESRHIIRPQLKDTKINSKGNRVICGKKADKNLLSLFGFFSFPVLTLRKLDMASEAEKRGWLEILNMTWFCHQPVFGKPCGSCNPCMSTLEEGLKYRFSLLSISRYRIKKIIISYPKTHMFLRKLKYGKDYSQP